jgi:DNA invertase Pin-like site-specific DNA recombinase
VVSGKSVIGHKEAGRMLADVRRGHITGLIFSKLARLSRNNRELLEFADIFKTCGAQEVDFIIEGRLFKINTADLEISKNTPKY